MKFIKFTFTLFAISFFCVAVASPNTGTKAAAATTSAQSRVRIDSLPDNHALYVGDSLKSNNGHHVLIMQTDGNLVQYTNGTAVWHTATSGRGAVAAGFEWGHLSIRIQPSLIQEITLWSSDTTGNAGGVLRMQDDGNLVIYSATGVALWDRINGKLQRPSVAPSVLTPGSTLSLGGKMTSQDGRYQLVLEANGDLVHSNTEGSMAFWHTSTANRGAIKLVMQTDGNLVIYTAANVPLWHAGTYGNPGAYLIVQTDGNAVIYTAANRPLWSSRGGRL
jgi:hypothetical protein